MIAIFKNMKCVVRAELAQGPRLGDAKYRSRCHTSHHRKNLGEASTNKIEPIADTLHPTEVHELMF